MIRTSLDKLQIIQNKERGCPNKETSGNLNKKFNQLKQTTVSPCIQYVPKFQQLLQELHNSRPQEILYLAPLINHMHQTQSNAKTTMNDGFERMDHSMKNS
jgi:hypothetical protein